MSFPCSPTGVDSPSAVGIQLGGVFSTLLQALIKASVKLKQASLGSVKWWTYVNLSRFKTP
jgi:hypothetical protein